MLAGRFEKAHQNEERKRADCITFISFQFFLFPNSIPFLFFSSSFFFVFFFGSTKIQKETEIMKDATGSHDCDSIEFKQPAAAAADQPN